MKIISLIVLFSITSCALWKEMSGEPRPRQTNVSTTPENYQITAQAVKIIDEARIKSADQKATFIVMKLSDGNYFSTVYLDEGAVQYREGHSVEVQVDGSPVIQKVDPTKQDDIVRFTEGQKLMEALKGKKLLKVELLMNKNKKYFDFDLEKIQKLFNASV